MMNENDYRPQGPIYKYIDAAGAIVSLKNQTFKFRCPLDFNDPFDCNKAVLRFSKTKSSIAEYEEALRMAGLPRIERRRLLRKLDDPREWQALYDHVISEKLAKSKVTCFSKSYSNTLMWSHYADQHKGICLECDGSMESEEVLERKSATVLCVNYDNTEVTNVNYNEAKDRGVVELFTRKSYDWHYEEEVRIIIMDDNPFQKFNKAFITGAIIGCRTPKAQEQELLDVIRANGYNINVRRAVKGNFQLEFKAVQL